jgi:uncharacterized protein (TIGR02231 family)
MASMIIKKNEIDLSLNSSVSEVTIFSDRALVTRAQRARCMKGENKISFSNLGSGIDEQSIKASVASDHVHITSTSLERNHLFFFREEEDESTYRRILEVLTRMCRITDDSSIYALENRMLADLHEYIRNLLNPLILAQENSIPKFKEALDFCESLLNKNAGSLIDSKTEMMRLIEEYDILKTELGRIRNLDKKEQNNIAIMVSADDETDADVELTYTIGGASWKTSYDAKADTRAKSVELSCYGEIMQATGEIWEKTKIILSTSVSETSARIPEIYPAYMGGNLQKRKKDIVIDETEIKDLREEGAFPEGENAAPPEDAGVEAADAALAEGRIQTAKKGVAYTFTIAGKLDIPPDGRWHKGLIMRSTVPAQLFYDTVPRLKEFVYLRADLKNTLSIPLLPGSILVYRNGSYMGRSALKYVAPDEPFYLSFGIDDDLRIKRIEYRNTLIPAHGLTNRNVKEWEYHYILYNYKQNKERVKIREAIYVSSIKEIEVSLSKETTDGYVMDKEGVVSWDIELPHDPFDHKKLVLRYSLSAPKDFNIENL